MKIRYPYRCDYCNTDKGETNHWWLRDKLTSAFLLMRWDQTRADCDDYEHICSESCASRALSKWMASQADPKVVAGVVNA